MNSGANQDTRTPDEARLGAFLLSAVRSADARVPVERRVPRTAAEQSARLKDRSQEGGAQ